MKIDMPPPVPTVAPYGSWTSPISTDFVTSAGVGLTEVRIDGDDIYWLESRPSEKGRTVIVKRSADGTKTDLLPAPFNARTRVHEYGGGSYVVSDGTVYFSNFADNRVYRIQPGEPPTSVTEDDPRRRYADFVADKSRQRLISIAEFHNAAGSEPINQIVGIDLHDGSVEVLADGNDFYASPVISPDGNQIAWLSWNHPNMPWDGSELWAATLQSDGVLGDASRIAGGVDVSVFQPAWSPDGILYFISDHSGWWNLYRVGSGVIEPVWIKNAEFGLPQWVFGLSTYAFAGPDTIICSYSENGIWHLASLDTVSGRALEIETPLTMISYVQSTAGFTVFVGASPSELPAVVSLDLTDGKYDVLMRSGDVSIPDACLSIAEPIEFPVADGTKAYANYYPPRNDLFAAPDGELPPLLVACHGGPTSASYSSLSPAVQYWTSRGYAYVLVNYGGSTGYGRDYRERLNGNWGIIDVGDSIDCALYLSDIGRVDGERLAIHGGSAGGYTALCALTFHEVFATGASLYGVTDLTLLASDTHKFESRYEERLMGGRGELSDVYRERSPINFTHKLTKPVIFFQGADDKVVPPNQAETMVEAMRQRNIPVAYLKFEGEGHGFRQSATIARCLAAHQYFYAQIFGIAPADLLEPVEIIGFS